MLRNALKLHGEVKTKKKYLDNNSSKIYRLVDSLSLVEIKIDDLLWATVIIYWEQRLINQNINYNTSINKNVL
jgi:hypothetical protein